MFDSKSMFKISVLMDKERSWPEKRAAGCGQKQRGYCLLAQLLFICIILKNAEELFTPQSVNALLRMTAIALPAATFRTRADLLPMRFLTGDILQIINSKQDSMEERLAERLFDGCLTSQTGLCGFTKAGDTDIALFGDMPRSPLKAEI